MADTDAGVIRTLLDRAGIPYDPAALDGPETGPWLPGESDMRLVGRVEFEGITLHAGQSLTIEQRYEGGGVPYTTAVIVDDKPQPFTLADFKRVRRVLDRRNFIATDSEPVTDQRHDIWGTPCSEQSNS